MKIRLSQILDDPELRFVGTPTIVVCDLREAGFAPLEGTGLLKEVVTRLKVAGFLVNLKVPTSGDINISIQLP